MYAVVVTSRISAGVSGGPQLPTITGCGLTWTNQVSKETSGATPNRRVSLVIGRGNPSPGALTMAFNAESQTLCHVQALEVSNCACVVQSTSANDGGVTGTTATVTLGAVSTYTDNITLGVVLVTSGLSPSVPKIPGAGFGSLDELYENVAGTSVFIEHKRGAQTASATWTGSNAWVILAAELQNKLALDFSF